MRKERISVVITNQESELEKLNRAIGDNTKPKDEIVKEIRFIPSRTKDKAWTLLYGIFNGARFAAFYAAVLFMPMADYIVCIATTPIFSYVFSCLLIKPKSLWSRCVNYENFGIYSTHYNIIFYV